MKGLDGKERWLKNYQGGKMGGSDGLGRWLKDYKGEERVENGRFRWFRKMVKGLYGLGRWLKDYMV